MPILRYQLKLSDYLNNRIALLNFFIGKTNKIRNAEESDKK